MHKKYRKNSRKILQDPLVCNNDELCKMDSAPKSRNSQKRREKSSDLDNGKHKSHKKRKSKSLDNSIGKITNDEPKNVVNLSGKGGGRLQSADVSRERKASSKNREKTFDKSPKVHRSSNKHSRHHSSDKQFEKRHHRTKEGHVSNNSKDILYYSSVPNPNNNNYEIKDLYTPRFKNDKTKTKNKKKKRENSNDSNINQIANETLNKSKERKNKYKEGSRTRKPSRNQRSKSPEKNSTNFNERSKAKVDLGPYEKYFALAEKPLSRRERSKEKKVKHESRAENIGYYTAETASLNTSQKKKRRSHIYSELDHKIDITNQNKAEEDFKSYFNKIQILIDKKLDVLINAKTKDGNLLETQNNVTQKHRRRQHKKGMKEEDNDLQEQYKGQDYERDDFGSRNVANAWRLIPQNETTHRRSKNKDARSFFKDCIESTVTDNLRNKEGENIVKDVTHEPNELNIQGAGSHQSRVKNLLDTGKGNKQLSGQSKIRELQDRALLLESRPKSCETFSSMEVSHGNKKIPFLKQESSPKIFTKNSPAEEILQDVIWNKTEVPRANRKHHITKDESFTKASQHSLVTDKTQPNIVYNQKEILHRRHKLNSLERIQNFGSEIIDSTSTARADEKGKNIDVFNNNSQPKRKDFQQKFSREPMTLEDNQIVINQQSGYFDVKSSKPDFIVQGIEPPSLECPRNPRERSRRTMRKPNLECKVVSVVGIPPQVIHFMESETSPSINLLHLSKEVGKKPVDVQTNQSITSYLPSEDIVERRKKTKRFKHYYKYTSCLGENSGQTSDVNTAVSDSYKRIPDTSENDEQLVEKSKKSVHSVDAATMTDIKKSYASDFIQKKNCGHEIECRFFNLFSNNSSNSDYSLEIGKKSEFLKMSNYLKSFNVSSKMRNLRPTRDAENRILLKLTSNSEIILIQDSKSRVYKSKSDVFKPKKHANGEHQNIYRNRKPRKNKFPSSTSGEEDNFRKVYHKTMKKTMKPKYNLKQILLENHYSNLGKSDIKLIQDIFTDSEFKISTIHNSSKKRDNVCCPTIYDFEDIIDTQAKLIMVNEPQKKSNESIKKVVKNADVCDAIEDLSKKCNKSIITLIKDPDMCDAETKTSVEKLVSVRNQEQSCDIALLENLPNKKPYVKSEKFRERVFKNRAPSPIIGSKKLNNQNLNTVPCCLLRPQSPKRTLKRSTVPNTKVFIKPENQVRENDQNYHNQLPCDVEKAQIAKYIDSGPNAQTKKVFADAGVSTQVNSENSPDKSTYFKAKKEHVAVRSVEKTISQNQKLSSEAIPTQNYQEGTSSNAKSSHVITAGFKDTNQQNQKPQNIHENTDKKAKRLYESKIDTDNISTPRGGVARKTNNQNEKLLSRQETLRKSPVREIEKHIPEPSPKAREYPRKHSCQRDNKLEQNPTRNKVIPRKLIEQKGDKSKCVHACGEKNKENERKPSDIKDEIIKIPCTRADGEDNSVEVPLLKPNDTVKVGQENKACIPNKISINLSNVKETPSKLPIRIKNNSEAFDVNSGTLDTGKTPKIKQPAITKKNFAETEAILNLSLTITDVTESKDSAPIKLKVASTKLLRSKSLIEIGSKKPFLCVTPHKSEMSFHEMVVSSKEETRISTLIQLERFGPKSKAHSFCKSKAYSLDHYQDSVTSRRQYSSRLFFTKNFKRNEMSSYQKRKLYDEKIRRKMKGKGIYQKDNAAQQIYEVRFLTMMNDDDDDKKTPESDVQIRKIETNEEYNEIPVDFGSNNNAESSLLKYLTEKSCMKNVFCKNSETNQQKIYEFCKNLDDIKTLLNSFRDVDINSDVFTLLERFCKSVVSYCDVTSASSNNKSKTVKIDESSDNFENKIGKTENNVHNPDINSKEVTVTYCSPTFAKPFMEESSELEPDNEDMFKNENAIYFGNGVSCPDLASHDSSFDFLYECESCDCFSKNALFVSRNKLIKNKNNQVLNQFVVHNHIPRRRTYSPPRSEESGYASVSSRRNRCHSVTNFIKTSQTGQEWPLKCDFQKYHCLGIEEQNLKSKFDHCLLDICGQQVRPFNSFVDIDQQKSSIQVVDNKNGPDVPRDFAPDVKCETSVDANSLNQEGAEEFINEKLSFTELKKEQPSVISCKIVLSNECLKTESATFVYPHSFDEANLDASEDIIDTENKLTVRRKESSNLEHLLGLKDPDKLKQLMGKRFFSNLLSVYEKEMEISRKLSEDDEFFYGDLLKSLGELKGRTHSAWGLKQTRSRIASLFKRKKCPETKDCLDIVQQQPLNTETDEYQTRLQSLAFNARRYFTMLVQAVKVNQNINDEIKLCGLLKLLERIEKGDFKVLRREEEVNFEEEIKQQMRQSFVSIYKISQTEAKKHRRTLTNDDLNLIRIFISKYRIGLLSKTDIIASYIGRGVIKSENQLKAAVTYLMRTQTSSVSLCEFEEFCGFK